MTNHRHHHHHDHGTAHLSDGRLFWSFVINQALTVAQVIAGIFSGSTALLSEKMHYFKTPSADDFIHRTTRVT